MRRALVTALLLGACSGRVPIAAVPEAPVPYCARASMGEDTIEVCTSSASRCMEAVSVARRFGGSVGVDGVRPCEVKR